MNPSPPQSIRYNVDPSSKDVCALDTVLAGVSDVSVTIGEDIGVPVVVVDGIVVGLAVGTWVGIVVVGTSDGTRVGVSEGAFVGIADGPGVGNIDGVVVGAVDGVDVLGCTVGGEVHVSQSPRQAVPRFNASQCSGRNDLQ